MFVCLLKFYKKTAVRTFTKFQLCWTPSGRPDLFILRVLRLRQSFSVKEIAPYTNTLIICQIINLCVPIYN